MVFFIHFSNNMRLKWQVIYEIDRISYFIKKHIYSGIIKQLSGETHGFCIIY